MHVRGGLLKRTGDFPLISMRQVLNQMLFIHEQRRSRLGSKGELYESGQEPIYWDQMVTAFCQPKQVLERCIPFTKPHLSLLTGCNKLLQ